MNVTEFLETLTGVEYATLREGDEEHTLTIRTTDPNSVVQFIEPDWECEEHNTHDDASILEYTRDKHHIKTMCVMTPHEFTPDTLDLNEMDVGDEETSQGYFREVRRVECECGAYFDGYDALKEFKEHK